MVWANTTFNDLITSMINCFPYYDYTFNHLIEFQFFKIIERF